MDTLISNVLRLLEERNWTVPDLALRSGISRTNLYGYIGRYRGGVSMTTIERLAYGFGVPLAELFHDPDKKIQRKVKKGLPRGRGSR